MALRNIRRIVPAVRNIRVQVSNSTITRSGPKLNYAKANQRWWIHVEFNSNIDLYIFEKALKDSEVRLVELCSAFYIEDPRIPDEADMAQAAHLADTFVAQLNGATRLLCPQFNGARKESMVELFEDGTGRGIADVELHLHGTSDFPEIQAFLAGETAPIRSILHCLKSNEDVQEALYYLGAEGNAWANLYKVSEIVEDHAGRSQAIAKKGWCSKSEWARFRQTANHQEAIGRFSRHARSRAVPPLNPMSIVEARLFAGKLVKRWLESLEKQR
jgi:hypothetical protein